MKIRQILMRVLFFIPMIIGILGLMLSGESFTDAFYQTISMYLANFNDTPANFLVEIARWTAMIATASAFIVVINFLREKAGNFIKYHFGRNSVAVYGPESEKSKLSGLKASRKINGKDRFVKAHSYVLLNDEAENFSFYNEHRAELENKEVYIKADPVWSRFISDVKIFSPEEAAARLFWKWDKLWDNNSPYELIAKTPGHKLNIVLLGFGKLGGELIYCGMQSNIYFADQEITYHVFGDCSEFLRTHTSLDYIQDKIIRYSDDWTNHLDLIESSDIVIVTEQNDQNTLIKDLLFTTVRNGIYIFSANDSPAEELMKLDEINDRFFLYPWQSESYKLENIVTDKLFEEAIAVNKQYKEHNPEYGAEWEELDAFAKYSNVSAADYDFIRFKMLNAMGIKLPKDSDKLTPDILEILSELEHIRWCRYHYLNNWTPMTKTIDGKTKDKPNRRHAYLVDYDELEDKIKKLDDDVVERLRKGKKN